MGTFNDSMDCWKCGTKNSLMVSGNTRHPNENNGVCLECGYIFYTKEEKMTKKELENERKEYEYTPKD